MQRPEPRCLHCAYQRERYDPTRLEKAGAQSDTIYKHAIATATLPELLHEVIDEPDLLTDAYYHDLRAAIVERANELLKQLET